MSSWAISSRGVRVRLASLASLALVAGASCSTPTSTTQLWQAQTPVRAPMTRVIVFGGGMTETGRRTAEDGFVSALAAQGVTAKQSYLLFPTLPEKEAARAAVQGEGFDGILVANLRGVREEPTYYPGSYNGGFWAGYYGPTWGASPGYVVTDEIVNVETTVWDLRANDALIWSATTKTTNPSSGGDFVKSLTKELLPKLANGGIIPRK